jgi:hypothetical protein
MDSEKNPNRMVVPLTQIPVNLQEVTIVAGENPAHRIIRQVTANRKINNPENIRSFRYNSHNKITVEFEINDTTAKGDSLRTQIRNDLRGGHLFLSETISERKFLNGRSQETILSTRTSGFREFAMPFSATSFQPFSFYNDHFQLMDINYLNPISRNSTSHYFFNIEDTIFQNQDTVFAISFRPRIGSNINGLKGVLQINTNTFAVQNVIAEPAEPGSFSMRIQQKYVFIEDTQWFPEQLNFDIIFGQVNTRDTSISVEVSVGVGGQISGSTNSPGNHLVMRGRSYINQIELFPELRKRDFSIDQVLLDASALLRDSGFWAERRVVPLDSAEIATYLLIDSVGEEANLDRIMMAVTSDFMQGNIPFSKYFSLDLSNILVVNEFERLRLGLGIRTRERLSKHVSFGGFFGYGIRDKLWKYGGDGTWNISRKHDIDLRLSYQNTLRETTGTTAQFTEHRSLLNLITSQDYRSFMASQMDQTEEKAVNFGFRALRYAKFNVGLSQTYVKALYPYHFGDLPSEDDTQIAQILLNNKYNYTNLNIGVRYAFRERFVRMGGQRMSLGTKFPIIQANYSRGIDGFLNGGFEYNKVEFRLDQSFPWRILGVSKIRVDAGFVDRPLPYGLLFTGEGNFDRKWAGQFFSPNYFQTMRKYEFLSDQYTNVFLSHNFGSIFLRIGKFRPHFTVHHNMSWGRLSNPEYQQLVNFKTKEKGFFESGLQIDRIFSSFGIGVYYRYGANAFERTQDNFVFKLSMTFSTN